jgi:iron complex transport system ATP-binding protein
MLVKGLRVKLGNRLILDNISLEVKPGITTILGPNGSGKTTLLRALISMVKPLEGEVVNDENLSYVPSEFYSPSMRVIDVLLAGRKRGDYIKYAKLVGVAELLGHNFSELSSGQKKLVLITKALAEGDLVIMDEPLSNLDIKNRKRIIDIITTLKTEKSFLITSHELEFINYTDYVIVIKQGKILFYGNKEGLSERILSEAYDTNIRKVIIDNKFYFVTD